MVKLGEAPETEGNDKIVSVFRQSKLHALTALDDDLFGPRGYYGKEDGIPIIFDSGCTHALTPFEADFIGTITPVNKVMHGLGAAVNIVGEGIIGWSFRDDYGFQRKVQVKAYLVTSIKVRLFSPQVYVIHECGGSFSMD